MSPLATGTLALAVIYAAVGGHALVMWAGRREDRVVWAFGMVCLSMGAYAVASAALQMAATVENAAAAQSAQLMTASLAAAFFLVFCHDLRGEPRRRVLAFGYTLPAVACVLGSLGLLVEDRPLHVGRTLGFGPNLVQAQLARSGSLIQAGLLLSVGAALLLAYGGEDRQRLRPAMWAPAIVVPAVLFDIWAEHARVNTLYMSEYAFLAIVIAVTQRLVERGRRRSDVLHHRTHDLAESTQRVEATKQELVRREQHAAIGEISAIVAHEFRNPLAIIRNAFTSLARDSATDRQWAALVDVVDDEADRLDRLVGDLLAYSRPLDPRPADVPASELLRIAAERSRHSDASSRRVTLELRDDGARCYADPDLMCQALCNLLENAHNAMPDGGTITMEARDELHDGRVATLFEVVDDGPGIPAALLGRVQELFFTTRAAGTGLGLAVVDRVISAHGGSMHIKSAPGQGTTVSLRVPRPPAARSGVQP